MKTLAIISQKGGVEKTTLATALAIAAEADGKSVAIFGSNSANVPNAT